MSDTLPPSPKQTEIAVLESEAERWKNLFRHVIFVIIGLVPDEMIDECISRLMKKAGKA